MLTAFYSTSLYRSGCILYFVSVTYCAILFYLNYFFGLSHSVHFTRSSRKRLEFRGKKGLIKNVRLNCIYN